MAEDLLGGLLGGEDQGGEAAAEARADADAFAAAMAVDHARRDPAVARAIKRFLEKQARLIEAQTRELEEQAPLRLRHLRLSGFGLRLRNGLQVFLGLIVAVVAIGLMAMVFDAFSARSVVVEPFDAPPALAARGLSGKVVAGGVLDALTRLQAATRGNANQRKLVNAWTSDIKVEVPETGVSIGDLDRLLKARLGRDIHIDGDLVQTAAGGLALTIRGDGVLPKTFEGGADDLDKLTTQAAEYVYGQSQPALYTTYLNEAGRDRDAVAFARGAYAGAGVDDKPYLLNVWVNALQNIGTPAEQTVPYLREAIRLKPDYWTGYANLMNVEMLLQNEEASWRIGVAMLAKAGGRPGRAPESAFQNLDYLTWNLAAWRAEVLGDAAKHRGIGSYTASAASSLADVAMRMHDPVDAAFQLTTARTGGADPDLAAIGHFVRSRMAAEAGDVATAASEMEAFQAAFANPVVSSNYAGYTCWVAPAEEAAGHSDKADAALKAGRFVDCYRFRGDILDRRGDWPGAQKAYAQAVAIAPDLPAAYYSWGLALARHGDLAGAEAKLAIAHEKGPGWADPLKALGDLRARRGRWREALRQYDAALERAPAWAALRQARAAAAAKA